MSNNARNSSPWGEPASPSPLISVGPLGPDTRPGNGNGMGSGNGAGSRGGSGWGRSARRAPVETMGEAGPGREAGQAGEPGKAAEPAEPGDPLVGGDGHQNGELDRFGAGLVGPIESDEGFEDFTVDDLDTTDDLDGFEAANPAERPYRIAAFVYTRPTRVRRALTVTRSFFALAVIAAFLGVAMAASLGYLIWLVATAIHHAASS
jgi:hypothetical protein